MCAVMSRISLADWNRFSTTSNKHHTDDEPSNICLLPTPARFLTREADLPLGRNGHQEEGEEGDHPQPTRPRSASGAACATASHYASFVKVRNQVTLRQSAQSVITRQFPRNARSMIRLYAVSLATTHRRRQRCAITPSRLSKRATRVP